jgi:hypothetical protein
MQEQRIPQRAIHVVSEQRIALWVRKERDSLAVLRLN